VIFLKCCLAKQLHERNFFLSGTCLPPLLSIRNMPPAPPFYQAHASHPSLLSLRHMPPTPPFFLSGTCHPPLPSQSFIHRNNAILFNANSEEKCGVIKQSNGTFSKFIYSITTLTAQLDVWIITHNFMNQNKHRICWGT
jgi:hypothetical protein